MSKAIFTQGTLLTGILAVLAATHPAEAENPYLNIDFLAVTASNVEGTDVTQHATAGALQNALNTAGFNGGGIHQEGQNLLNVATFSSEPGGTILQDALAQQTVRNVQDAGPGPLVNASQSASNLANLVDASDVNIVNQVFREGSAQVAENEATHEGGVDGLDQMAANVLNSVEVTGVANVVDQQFPVDATQTARNLLLASEQSGESRSITQEAANVANLVRGEDVGLIDRNAFGQQHAENRLEFSGSLEDAYQSGMNVANLAEVGSFGEIRQNATGDQVVVNVVTSLAPGQNGEIATLTQTGSNLANLTVLTGGRDGLGEISQTATVNQQINNDLNTSGRTVNVVQNSTTANNQVIIAE